MQEDDSYSIGYLSDFPGEILEIPEGEADITISELPQVEVVIPQ